MLLDILCKANFILVFDLHELTSCLFILFQWFQLGDLREICNPAITDLTGDPVCKQRISMSQETSLRDTIRLIVELLRHHLIEIFQFLLLKDLRMKLCNTINREACYDRHICHTNLSIHKDCHFPYFLFISRIRLTNLDHEAAVNLLYDLINTRKQTGEDFNRPFFQCFCHDGMVGVCTGLRCDFPCLIPAKSLYINQKTHQLRYSNRRVRIVHLNDNFFIQLSDVSMLLFIFCDQCLKTCRNEEVLLLQTKLFS